MTDDRAHDTLRELSIGEPILQFFAWKHLPPELAAISAPFGQLAIQLHDTLPRNAERSTAFRKLLEGKDAAVRGKLMRMR